MTNSNNDIEELEELLTELEGQEARIVTPYSEEDDAVTRLMEAPLGDQDWMVQVTALDRRMMSTPQLLSELSGGRISSRTLVWRGGMSDWLPIARVDELSRASAAPVSAPSRAFVNLAPPPPPPPQPSKPMWASPAPSAPLPPPPVAMAPPIGIAPAVGLGMASTMISPGVSSSGFGSAPPMGLTPPPPAPPVSAYNLQVSPAVSASPSLPPSSQGNTTRPVAIDFSDMMAENDPPLQSKRWVMALSAVAILAVFVTVYSLSSGGGDEAKAAASAAQPQAVSSLQPASSSAAKEKPAPAAAPAAETAKVEKQEEPEQAPMAATTAKANDEEEATSRSEESRSASASARQTAQARYSLRSEYRRRSRGGSSAGESSRDDDDSETPARAAAPARAAVAAAPAAEEEAPPSSEAPAAVAEEVDEAPKSTGKASGSTFNRDAAKAALDEAAAQVKNCRPQGGPSGTGRVQVRYEPSGKVANVAILTSKFDNTTTGSCVRMLFRRAKVPEFTGAPVVVVNKSFDIP